MGAARHDSQTHLDGSPHVTTIPLHAAASSPRRDARVRCSGVAAHDWTLAGVEYEELVAVSEYRCRGCGLVEFR